MSISDSRYWTIPAIVVLIAGFSSTTSGQAGLRESLEKMDRNENGYLDPNEITALSRPYLEKIMSRGGRNRRIDFNEPIRISRIQEAARYYFAVQNGVQGTDVRPEIESPLKEFKLKRDETIVPGFGLAKIKFPYTQADLDEADSTMRRCDRDRDGMIDRQEAARNRWTHRNPFDDDANKDGKLSRLELAQRYARRRLVQSDAGELWKKAIRTGSGVKPSTSRNREEERRRWDRDRSVRFAYDLLSRFDRNRDRKLDEKEVEALGVPLIKLDENNDSFVSREEIQAYMTLMQSESSELVEGIPEWFGELDKNRNDQIEMVEFADEWTKSKLQEFAAMDVNNDGLLTIQEAIDATASSGAQYVSEEAEILPPGKTIVSEIDIQDSGKISEIQVTLSITHTYVSHLDAYLIGPEGQRVELFTAVGGSDDHFVRTVIDDQSKVSIAKSRPPFTGTFRPEAIDKKQPGLGQFKGKSIKGVWQLMIRGSRSDRFGMLHQWGLKVVLDD